LTSREKLRRSAIGRADTGIVLFVNTIPETEQLAHEIITRGVARRVQKPQSALFFFGTYKEKPPGAVARAGRPARKRTGDSVNAG
jgi:hypothetical protein